MSIESDTPVSEATTAATLEFALKKARREERLTEAALRRKRAEVARLIALGHEAEAERLVKGIQSTSPHTAAKPATKRSKRQAAAEPVRHTKAQQPTAPEVRTTKEKQPAVRRGADSRTARPAPAPHTREEAKPFEQTKPVPASKKLNEKPGKKPARRKWRRKSLIELWTDWLGRRPPWAVSAVVHGLLLAAFALLTFSSLGEPSFLLSASFADDSFDETLAEVQLVEWQTPLDDAAPLVETSELLLEAVEELVVEAPTPLLEVQTPIGELPSDPSELMASTGAGRETAEKSSPQDGDGQSESAEAESMESAPPGKVSFFGAESLANRVVFVVDNSGSMQRGRMETALKELNRAVMRLTPEQSFYVIFYSDQAYPMFYPEPIHELLPATRENKQRLNKWLRSVEMCLGGRLLDAVELASTLDPEVVYLLSDGDIRSTRVMQRLTTTDAWPFYIHTLGMGARNRQHAENLVNIAQVNRGTFTFVDADPAALRRSLAKPLPYHRRPGETWGSAVQPWD